MRINTKKGQVTLFIILGMLILVFFGLYYYQLVYIETPLESTTSTEQTVVQQYVESCLTDVSQEGVQYIASRGGYYDLSEYNVRYMFEGMPLAFDIPYYLYESKNTMPSLEYFGDSISEYIKVMMPYCLENMGNNTSLNLDIDDTNMGVETIIFENIIDISLTLPIIINKETSQEITDTYATSFESSLYKLYITAEEINTMQKESVDSICLSCLLKYESNGVDVAINDFVGNDNLYVLFFKLTEKNNTEDPMILLFAERYILGETANLKVDSVPDQNITVGYEYTYQVSASGKNVTYSDETDLFEINSLTGLIQFTPSLNDLGRHLIKVTVQDVLNNTDAVFFEIEVLNAVNLPILEYIDSFVAYDGEEFEYTVNATDPNNYTLYYYDDSELFDINPSTGNIVFTPTSSEKGEYTVIISAVNEMGGVDEQEVNVIII